MLQLTPQDDALEALVHTELRSSIAPGIRYVVAEPIGQGGMAIALLAVRVGPDGRCPVVIKILRPSFVARCGSVAALVMQKEAVALGRLNERIPPTPFVVRLLDAGTLDVAIGRQPLALPWIAVEHVRGGPEGTTLHERVRLAIDTTGSAFAPERAARALEQIAAGIDAVHEVGVVHRDVKPDNVLCCGSGEHELFKLADFGLARPVGIGVTFGAVPLGTPGYAAPELATDQTVGPATDVFSFAALTFFLLTGEDYFTARTLMQGLLAVRDGSRRRLADAAALGTELRDRPRACRAIDEALGRATAMDAAFRPQSASALAAMILPALRPVGRRVVSASITQTGARTTASGAGGWRWTTRQQGHADLVVRNVAWDGDGRCATATNHGLMFWCGTEWARATNVELPGAARFVHRLGPGRWLVGCDAGALAVLTSDGIESVTRVDPAFSLCRLSGDIDDLAVAIGAPAGGPPSLYALVGRHWLRPLPVPEVASIADMARVEPTRWLLAGRGSDGRGFAGIYAPLDWHVERLATASTRALLSAAGRADLEIGMVTGTAGASVRFEGSAVLGETIDPSFDVAASAIDESGQAWAGAAGRLWVRDGATGRASAWRCVWHDPTWGAPFVSLFASAGLVLGLTADGGVLEGRSVSTGAVPIG